MPRSGDESLSILAVDDNSVDRDAIERALPARFVVSHATTGAEARERCVASPPDCVLLDYRLPDTDGIELIPFFVGHGVPAVLLTGHGDEALAADAIQRGAQDYLTKDRLHPELLETTILRAVQRHRADQHFRLALEAVPSGMLLCDRRGTIQLVNAAAERMFGYSRSELIGQSVEMLVPETSRTRHAELRGGYMKKPETRSVAGRASLEGRRASGESFPAEIGLSPIRALDGDLVLCSITDTSERHDLERQMQAAQRMEAVGRLAGGIAHDFNNLLTVIQTYAAFLHQSFRDGDPARDDVQAIQDASARAAALTRQLLAFSRRQVLEPQTVPVNRIVRNVHAMLRRLIGEDIEIEIALSDDAGLVHVDPHQLDQVLINLAVNARDAMPEGGTLRVETTPTVLDESVAVEKGVRVVPGDYVTLRVIDTGTGMDAETLGHVFEPFFTSKERDKGTGLGLSTVYGIVKQSDGYIWVSSALGEGTTFEVLLPVAEGPVAEEPAAPAVERARGHGTILLVEDERMVRRVTTRILERHGYQVIQAANGGDALLLVEESVAPIDLLLTDVILPTVSGPSLARRLQERHPKLPVIFMSGYPDDAIAERGVLEPGTTFISKPFTAEILLSRVREKLEDASKGVL